MAEVEPDGAISRSLEYWPKVYGFAVSLTRDAGNAEDLCQEAYTRLIDKAASIDLEASLLPLLLTIVRNLFISEKRRKKSSPLDSHAEELIDLKADDPALVVEHKLDLRDALNQLPDRWRAALYMKDGLGFSYREIAQVIDSTTDSVRVMLHRARKRLREHMRKGSANAGL